MIGNKGFPEWSNEKVAIHTGKQRPFFHIREVWFCALGVNIGYEQDGRGKEFLRPIVVVKKFNNEVLWGVPLTTNQKIGKYYFSFQIESKEEKSTAIFVTVEANRRQATTVQNGCD